MRLEKGRPADTPGRDTALQERGVPIRIGIRPYETTDGQAGGRGEAQESFVAGLDRFDIEATIVSSARAVVYEIVSGNAEVLELMKADTRIYGAVVVNPHHYQASVKELEKYRADKRFVAAKFHPDYCGLAADSPAGLAVVEAVAKMEWPLLLHTWGAGQIGSALAVARRFPKMPVFMFHMGGSEWRAALREAVDVPNVFVEIISTIPEAQRIGEAVKALGVNRVFFGSDMTLLSPAYGLGLVDDAGLSESDRERVLGLNAREFFHIP